jgi:hypothetical protein
MARSAAVTEDWPSISNAEQCHQGRPRDDRTSGQSMLHKGTEGEIAPSDI